MNYIKLALIYLYILIILSVIPTGDNIVLNEIEVLSFRADYLVHCLIFLPWMILAWLDLNKKGVTSIIRFKYALIWFAAGLFIAISSEVVQIWLPHRSYNPVDLFYNVAGIGAGLFIFLWTPRALRSKQMPYGSHTQGISQTSKALHGSGTQKASKALKVEDQNSFARKPE